MSFFSPLFSPHHHHHYHPCLHLFWYTDYGAQDTLLARPVAIKTLRERSEKESGETDQQYFRSIKDYKLKAGETVPGAAGSALRRAHGDLGWTPGRKVRWFERRKLGIDRPLTWEQV
jgi:large subunit ribosomal protein L17